MDSTCPEKLPLFMEKPEMTLQVKKSNLACDLADETVILNMDTGIYYGLDRIGTYIWKLLKMPMTYGQIEEHILDRFDVEHERCAQDVTQLLQDFIAKGLVDINAPIA